ncbi:MAG: MFS transporter [Candidatus Lokiarchaeota archaeon]|nr:MFS transporter [Candidatus Lokiarchaeota archaeon]
MTENKSEEKFDIKHTFFIGLAFFTTGISWSLYNTRVNQQLDNYFAGFVLAGLAVGILMALDNMLGVIIQPIMGTVSDNTRSKYGRRIPYIIVGVICSAIFFALIPTGFLPTGNLPILLIWMLFFSLSMGFYRSQAVALMPDFVKPQHRSKANAIINIMGGIGAIVAYTMGLVSGVLGLQLIFIIASIIMVVALLVLVLTVNENDAYSYKLLLETEAKEGKVKEKKEKVGLVNSFKDILNEEDKSTLFILLAIFAWFIGYQGLEAFFSIYAASGPNGVLNQTDAFASFMFNFVAIPFIIAAFPLSLLASRIGRKKCIQIGLIIMILSMLIGFLIQTLTVTMIILVLFGIGWAFVNVNSIVIVWELAPNIKKIGTYTGLYYFFSVLAAIIGPGIVGGLRDLFGPGSLLLDGLLFFVVAFIFIYFVKRGEVELTDEEKIARKKAIEEL